MVNYSRHLWDQCGRAWGKLETICGSIQALAALFKEDSMEAKDRICGCCIWAKNYKYGVIVCSKQNEYHYADDNEASNNYDCYTESSTALQPMEPAIDRAEWCGVHPDDILRKRR
jgi:hypothetical protein